MDGDLIDDDAATCAEIDDDEEEEDDDADEADDHAEMKAEGMAPMDLDPKKTHQHQPTPFCGHPIRIERCTAGLLFERPLSPPPNDLFFLLLNILFQSLDFPSPDTIV